MKPVLRVAAGLCVAGLLLATVLAELGRWHWFAELFVNFRVQYVWLLAICGAVAALAGARRWAFVAAIGLAVNAAAVAAQLLPQFRPDPAGARPLRVVSFNAFFLNRDYRQVAAFVRRSGADVAVLTEVPAEQVPVLTAEMPSLPYRYVSAGGVLNGALVYSPWSIPESSAIPLGQADVRAARVSLDIEGRDLTFYGVHLH